MRPICKCRRPTRWASPRIPGASAIGGNDYDNEGGGSRYLDLKEKGLSPFDVRQSLVASVNWNVPFGRGGTGVTAALIRDWTVGTLVRLKAGDPFSVNTGGLNRGGFSPDAPDYPDLCPGADANPVQGGPEQYFDPTAFCLQPQDVIGNAPRNSLIGPGAATVDLMVSRALLLGGSRSVQLRFEVFNLFNRANFGQPTSAIFNAGRHRLPQRRWPHHEHDRHAAADAAGYQVPLVSHGRRGS